MDALEAMLTRQSIRSFTPGAVPREIIEKIIDAARHAPTARNVQAWEFVVVTKPAMRKKLAKIADYGAFIAEAPVCVAVLSRDTKYWLEDGCAATENIIIAARAYGLGHCWVAGAKKPYAEKVVSLLGAPEGFHLVSLIPIGYYDEAPKPPGKRKLEKVLHWEKF